MDRRAFLRAGAAAAALGPLAARAGAGPAEGRRRPSFVVIMADDISPHRYGCYGDGGDGTPNIDRLAADGVAFATCWATPICQPTRALLMTGRYAHRTGWYHNALKIPGPDGSLDFKKSHIVFSRALQEAGYATCIAGKWQLHGWAGAAEAGFDEFCLYQGNVAKRIEQGEEFGGLYETTEGAKGYHQQKIASRYWGPAVNRNGELMEVTPEDFGPDIWTDYIIDFMRRNRDRAFCAYYPMELPHCTATGSMPTTPLSGRPGDLSGGTLAECNRYVDLLVGRILDALDEFGLRDSTYVLFTSDNGGQGTDGRWAKNTATEFGARVPLVVGGGSVMARPGLSPALAGLADVMPTLLDLAGVALPDGYELDGVSLAPYLRGESEATRPWVHSYLGTARMLRDDRWLLESVDTVYGSPRGRFFDCGQARDPRGYERYREVTDSTAPEVLAARERFDRILAGLPSPDRSDPAIAELLDTYDGYVYRHRVELRRRGERSGQGPPIASPPAR
jgi:arylsulfatase A-like enzyme